MEKHLKFRLGEQKKFIGNTISVSKLTLNQLATYISISPRNLRDWRSEKLCITKSVVEKLSKRYGLQIPEKIDVLEKRWIKNRSQKAKIGGLAFKELYGSPATPEGRSKGGRTTMEILRENGTIPPIKKFNHPRYSEKLAEFTGIMLGDGGITPSQIQITLNSIADKEYLSFVKKLCTYLFKSKPKVFKKKNCNANVIYYNGVDLIKFLEKIGLKIGNKVKLQVDVPKWIKQNSNYSIACLRGLMDTDGCISIHKYKVNRKEYFYKNLIFTNCSIPLAEFVYKRLIKVGLHPKMVKVLEKRRVWLYNTNEAKEYLYLVGSSNQRLNRFKQGG
jgi:predicted DNA-binding antitoxin AbrB/MazE fold protein